MKRKRIDLRKIVEGLEKEEEEKKNTGISREEKYQKLKTIAPKYQLSSDKCITIETPIPPYRWGIKHLTEEMWEIIIHQARIEVESGRDLPSAISDLKTVEDLKVKCVEFENKVFEIQEQYSKELEEWKRNLDWYNEILGKINKIEELAREINRLKRLLKDTQDINYRSGIEDKIRRVDYRLHKFIETLRKEENQKIDWNKYYEEKDGKRIYSFSTWSVTCDVDRIAKEEFENEKAEFFEQKSIMEKQEEELRNWLDKLYKKYHGSESEDVYRIRTKEYPYWEHSWDGKIIKPIEHVEFLRLLVKADIPLTEEVIQEWYGGWFSKHREGPLCYGFYNYNEETEESFEINITPVAIRIFLEDSLWWLWPESNNNRIKLLKKIKETIEEIGYEFPRTVKTDFEKRLIQLNLMSFFEYDRGWVDEEEFVKLTKEEELMIKREWPFYLVYTGNGNVQEYSLQMNYYRKGKKTEKTKPNRSFNIEIVEAYIEKIRPEDEDSPVFRLSLIVSNIKEQDYEEYENYCSYEIRDVVTALKLLNEVTEKNGYVRIDHILTKESLELIETNLSGKYRETIEGFEEAAYQFFLQLEAFNFNDELILGDIARRPSFRGTNWERYVKEYNLWKSGMRQDDIAMKFNTSQQTISNHIQRVEGELARLRGEAYEKWLEERYKLEADVIKVERNGAIGEPDLTIYKRNNYVEVINAKAYSFKPSRTHFTIDAKEYQPEIEKARELEKRGYRVKVFIDFFNLFNQKRYPRILIDHRSPPDRVTIRYTDAEQD